MKRSKEYYRGCLIGGAIGDAMGWPVEFLSLDEIKRKYGSKGIRDLQISNNGKAEITDDTQMTLFTAEGILQAEMYRRDNAIIDTVSCVYFAYMRWLHTQGYDKNENLKSIYQGELLKVKELYVRRAPGISCLSALASRKQGLVYEPINDSKGCGGVMRVAPIGLFYSKEEAFKVAVDCAAITHGHPLGYLSAGALACIISCIIEGLSLEESIKEALIKLKNYRGHEKCTKLINKAIDLSKTDKDPVEAIGELGEGWVGEEALAISIYCALKYSNDFEGAICAAVNHDGDSDSTGSITGNILGVYIGIDNIPEKWTEHVELMDVIIKMADGLLLGK